MKTDATNMSVSQKRARAKFVMRIAISFALSCFAGADYPSIFAHKFYTSIAHAEYNSETKSLEVSTRIFPDDLELALTKRSGKVVTLDGTKDVAALALGYLQETFELKDAAGHIQKLSWVGMDAKVDVVWVYFEIKLPAAPERMLLRDRLLCELFPEQVNVVQLINGERKNELIFKRDNDFQAVTFNN